MPQSNNETQQGVSGARQIVERQPGLAGQYQVAYNPERDVLFVTGSFNHTKTHGTLCATLARLNVHTLETELTAYLPVVEDHNPPGRPLPNSGRLWGGPRQSTRSGMDRRDPNQTVTAYSQDDLSLVWDSRSEDIEMLTPRELYVAPDGSVLVTGAGGYQVISAANDKGSAHRQPPAGFWSRNATRSHRR